MNLYDTIFNNNNGVSFYQKIQPQHNQKHHAACNVVLHFDSILVYVSQGLNNFYP
jgi:hypothetical protein